ncbi:MAG: AAA family ATPase, partial [Chromatium okenii]|nr:AAA family ATPase [Chromatium okenii]
IYGLSPRAGLGILHAAKAWALLAAREYVIPEDVQAVLPACAIHRLVGGEPGQRIGEDEVAAFILNGVAL